MADFDIYTSDKYADGRALEAAIAKGEQASEDVKNKVDKVSGKGLSTNDYTTAEKQKLAGLENYDDTGMKAEIDYLVNAGAKNLLKLTEASSAVSGVTFDVDKVSGIVTATGTSSGTSSKLVGQFVLPPGKYIFTASEFASFQTQDAYAVTEDGRTIARDLEGSKNFELTEATTVKVNCRTRSAISSAVFKPMIRPASIKDGTFVPYAPTNRELYEMIKSLMPAAQSEEE